MRVQSGGDGSKGGATLSHEQHKTKIDRYDLRPECVKCGNPQHRREPGFSVGLFCVRTGPQDKIPRCWIEGCNSPSSETTPSIFCEKHETDGVQALQDERYANMGYGGTP